MTVLIDVLVGLAMAIGLAGAVIQVIPSALLIGAALLVWGAAEGGVAWWIVGIGIAILIASTVLKYAVPGKRLKDSATPNSTLLIALGVGVIGWFLVPVVGLLIGAVGAVYLMERSRLQDHEAAKAETIRLLKTLGLSILIEVVAALAVISLWIIGLILV